MSRLLELGAKHAPITDRASTFGFARWDHLCKTNRIHPVWGVELAVTNAPCAKKPVVDYWTFTATNDLQPLNELIELATNQFRYQPLLSVSQAIAAAGPLNVVTGHRPLGLPEKPPSRGCFIGLSPATTRGLLSKYPEWKVIATGCNRYPRIEDAGFYEVMGGRLAEVQLYPQHILNLAEWRASIARLGLTEKQIREALRNLERVSVDCTAELQRASLPRLKRKKQKTLRAMCVDGANKRGIDLGNKIYRHRLDRELKMISEKKFDDYFYIVSDLVSWARENMMVGPARGSSCGSLVCYLLGITSIDPIPHGLLFERFIDVNRHDLPDIDIDFSDQKRDLIFKFLHDRYGAEHCARLGTVMMYQPKSALNEVGAALHVPRWETDAVAQSIVPADEGDARADLTLQDTLEQAPAGRELIAKHPEMNLAKRFQAHPRHYSQHAAGVVIAAEPISKYVAIDARTGATMCDKKDAERFNLLKIDALGLTQLSVFEDALMLAGLPRDTLDKLPLDDPKAFDILNQGKFFGVFQFNGQAVQSITERVTIDCFDDIAAITALARPGPLQSGGADTWIGRRTGRYPVAAPHPLFDEYLRETYGVLIYQEQVMQIARGIGDLDWPEVSMLRKLMSQRRGREAFDKYGEPWKKRAIEKGVPQDIAQSFWDDLCAMGVYSFNKSHSVAYGLISYWCAWLKAHYPTEFCAATLSHEADESKQLKLLREIVAEGSSYIPIDRDKSGEKWSVADKGAKLIGPLSAIKGVGPKMMQHIMFCRANGLQLSDRAEKLLTHGQTVIDSLYPIRDAIQRIMPDPIERKIYTTPTLIGELKPARDDRPVLIIGVASKITQRSDNEDAKVKSRGWKIPEGQQHAYLNVEIEDDSGAILCQIKRRSFDEIGKPILDRGRVGKAIYAVKGKLNGNRGDANRTFKMITVEAVRYIGDIDQENETTALVGA